MRRDRTAHSRTLPVTYRSSRVTNGTRKESEPSVSSCPSLSLVIHMPFISLTLGPQPMIHPVPSSFVGALVPLSLVSLSLSTRRGRSLPPSERAEPGERDPDELGEG